MSSTTKPYEEKMNASVNHLIHELASIRAGRANPAILDKVTVDYYAAPRPSSRSRCRRRRGPHPDHLPVGPLDAQAHLQGHPDQRHRHQPH